MCWMSILQEFEFTIFHMPGGIYQAGKIDGLIENHLINGFHLNPY